MGPGWIQAARPLLKVAPSTDESLSFLQGVSCTNHGSQRLREAWPATIGHTRFRWLPWDLLESVTLLGEKEAKHRAKQERTALWASPWCPGQSSSQIMGSREAEGVHVSAVTTGQGRREARFYKKLSRVAVKPEKGAECHARQEALQEAVITQSGGD